MKKIRKYIILFVIYSVILSQAINIIITILKNKFKINLNLYLDTYKTKEFIAIYLVLLIGGILYYLVSNLSSNKFKEVLKNQGGEYSHFLTQKEIRKSKDFKICKSSKLMNANSGIILSSKEKGRDIKFTILKPTHSLIIGTTGSGKNVGFIDNNIFAISKTKEKPSFLIADPKGENYSKHKKRLEEDGYEIKLIDLRNPYQSTKWNPFFPIIDKLERIKNLKKEKEFDKTQYQELKDEISQDAKDIISTMFPFTESSDMTWQEGARSLILAFSLAMIEDIENKENYCESKNLIPYNIFYNISKYANDSCKELKNYIESRSKFSKVPTIAGAVLSSIDSEKTLSSYLSQVQAMIQKLNDNGILSLTSNNEVEIDLLDEKPTAIFICIPDEKITRHPFATLFISQVYKALVDKAQRNFKNKETKDRFLKRHFYFILDEFGNLPKFDHIENMITVARSRKIFFEMIIQSFEQLEAVYGSKVAKIIKGNCNLKVFLGTTEKNTQDEFSYLCGKKLVENSSLSSSEKNQQESISAKETPLITPDELSRLNNSDNFGNIMALCFGYYPLKDKFQTSFNSKVLKINKDPIENENKSRFFQEEEYIYDIKDILKLKKEKEIEEKEEKEMKSFNQSLKENKKMQISNMFKKIKRIIDDFNNILTNKEKEEFYSLTVNINNNKVFEILKNKMNEYIEDIDILKKLEQLNKLIKNLQNLMVENEGDSYENKFES